jgi:hypothetical protein
MLFVFEQCLPQAGECANASAVLAADKRSQFSKWGDREKYNFSGI